MKSFPFYWHMRSSCGFEKPGWVGQAGWEGWPPVVVGPSGRWLVGAPSGLPLSPSAASVTSPTASLGSPLGISVFCDHGSLSSPRLTSLWVSSLGPCSTRMLLLAMTQNFQETKKKKTKPSSGGVSSLCPVPSAAGAQGSAYWEKHWEESNARSRLAWCRAQPPLLQPRTPIRRYDASGLSESRLPLAHTLEPRNSCFLVLWTTTVRHERLRWLKGGRSGFPEPSASQRLTSARSFTSRPTRSSVFLAGILRMLI